MVKVETLFRFSQFRLIKPKLAVIALLGIALLGMTLATNQLKYNLIAFDRGRVAPTDPASNKTAQNILFTDVQISSLQPLLNEPVEISGWLSNLTDTTLHLNIGLGLDPVEGEEGFNVSDEIVDKISNNLVMRTNNGLNITILPNQQHAFHFIFESHMAFDTPLSLGLSAVGDVSGKDRKLLISPALGNFRVRQPAGLENLAWLAEQFPLALNLLLVLVPLTGVAYWKILPARRKLTAWKIVVTDRVAAPPLYWGTLGYGLAMLITLLWPAFDSDTFFTMLLGTHWFLLVWMALPIIYTAAFAWWSKNLVLALAIVTIAYLQLYYSLGSHSESNYLMAPTLSLVGAALVAAMAFYLIGKKQGRSMAGIYLALCSLVLLLSSSSAFFIKG